MKKYILLSAIMLMGVVLKLKAQDETNDSCKLIIAPVLDFAPTLDGVGEGADGYYIVTINKKEGVLSHDGEKGLVPPIFDDVEIGADKLFIVTMGKKKGVVTSNEKEVTPIVPIEYDGIRLASVGEDLGGLILVWNNYKERDEIYTVSGIYNKEGVLLHPVNITGLTTPHIDMGGVIAIHTKEDIYDNLFEKGRIVMEKGDYHKTAVFHKDGTIIDIYDSYSDMWYNNYVWRAAKVERNGDAWGVVKRGVLYKGNLIVPVEYDEVDISPKQTLIKVIKNKQCGVINEKGEYVVPLGKYGNLIFNETYIIVEKDGKNGVLNSMGGEIVPIGMYSRCDIGQCELDEKQNYIEVESNGKKGVINDNGKVFVPIGKYEKFKVLNKNIAEVMSNGKVGIINNIGTLIVPIGKYDKLLYRYGVIIYTKNGKHGVLGKDGNEVTMAEYDNIEPQRHSIGMAVVRKDDKIGVINCDGKVIVPLGKYNDCRVNEEIGLAESDEGTMFFDRNGKILAPIGKLETCLKQYGINRLYPLNSNNSKVGLFYFKKDDKYGIMKLW